MEENPRDICIKKNLQEKLLELAKLVNACEEKLSEDQVKEMYFYIEEGRKVLKRHPKFASTRRRVGWAIIGLIFLAITAGLFLRNAGFSIELYGITCILLVFVAGEMQDKMTKRILNSKNNKLIYKIFVTEK